MEKQENNTQSETSTNDFAVGAIVFEKFEILGFIAAGGKGRVYKAKDILLNNVVALKVLLGEGRNEKDLVRFQSEARTASRLKHKNIATIYDFGLSGGSPYLSMEFVEGQSLEEILEIEKTLSLPIFFEVFIQVCEALIHAHKNGVVHRDLKPGNIAIREIDQIRSVGSTDSTNGELIAKVLDFGVAKRIDALVEQEGRLTPTGDIVGSPLYMSPEQSQGISVTPQSDVYSLGCVMWNCLAGEPPFLGDTAMETILHHQKTTPDNLSERVPFAVPDQLSEMIQLMLSKVPEQRGSLEDSILPTLVALQDEFFADQLEQEELERENLALELFDKKSATTTDTTPAPNKKISKSLIAVGSIFILLVIVMISSMVTNKKSEPSDTTRIATPISLAVQTKFEEKGSFRVAVVDNDLRVIKDWNKVTAISASSPTITDKGISYLADAQHVRRLDLSGTSVKTLAGIGKLKSLEILELKHTEITDRSLANLAGLSKLRSLSLSDTALTDDFVKYLPALPGFGDLELSGTTVSAKALTKLKKQPWLQTLRLTRTPLTVADVRMIVSNIPSLGMLDLRKCPNLSLKDLQGLKREYPAIYFESVGCLLTEHEEKAAQFEKAKLYSAAQHYYDICISELEHEYGKEHPKMLSSVAGAARTSRYKKNPDYKESEAYLERAIRLAHRYQNDIAELNSLDALSNSRSARTSFKASEAVYVRAHRLAQQMFSESNPQELDNRCQNLGQTYVDVKDWPKAARIYQESVALRKRLYGPEAQATALSMIVAADCYRAMKNYSSAGPLYKSALKVMEKTPPRNFDQRRAVLMAYAGFSQVEFLASHTDKAVQLNETCCRLSKGTDDLVYVTALAQRIDYLRQLKRPNAEIRMLTTELKQVQDKLKMNPQARGNRQEK